MEVIQQEMVDAKRNESVRTLKEVKRFCKEFEFMTGMLKCSLVQEGEKSEIL